MTPQGGSHGPFHQVPLASTRIEKPQSRSQLPWKSLSRQPQKRSSNLWAETSNEQSLWTFRRKRWKRRNRRNSPKKRGKVEYHGIPTLFSWFLLCFLVASATNSGSETKGTMFDSIQTPLAQASKKTSSETVRVPTADGLWHMKKVLPLCIQTFRPRKTGKLLSAGSVCQHMYI